MLIKLHSYGVALHSYAGPSTPPSPRPPEICCPLGSSLQQTVRQLWRSGCLLELDFERPLLETCWLAAGWHDVG
jgi:hypothetical protein